MQERSAKEMLFYARCAGGFEPYVADELRALGAKQVRPLRGCVSFAGGLDVAYRACLQSRIATRVQLRVASVAATDADVLYSQVKSLEWEDIVQPGATIAVYASGTNAALRNTKFTALKVKDAVCDRLRSVRGQRPNVDVHAPDLAIDVVLHPRDGRASVFLNVAGESLHRRGYRVDGKQVEAPLKETLAAGMLAVAGWLDSPGVAFVDPMCGSGTLAIEAALAAFRIAPGIVRESWGFAGWLGHSESLWESVRADALQHAQQARAAGFGGMRIVAADVDKRAVAIARECARRAGVEQAVEFFVADAADFAHDVCASLPSPGLLATNPPYGQRLLAAGGLEQAYAALGQAVRALPDGWQAAVITPEKSLDVALGYKPRQVLACHNGPLEASIRLYDVGKSLRHEVDVVSLDGVQRSVNILEATSDQFAARLRKVAKERAKWARKEGVTCYRIYDADLPDYAVAVDVYGGAGREAGERFVRVVEYQAPKEVDATRAASRFADVCALVPAVLDVPADHVFSKVRRRAKGGSQYVESLGQPRLVHVREAGFEFEVDLNGHVDTGLFLDHRSTRALVGSMAGGKRFLNLFAYTGTATVYAAGGGAASTTTVDLSNTYLETARRNMGFNGFSGPEHSFVRADVLAWLDEEAARKAVYELVFCDPPTFSNSKRMQAASFDMQRDHVRLLQQVARILDPCGTIVFSCNLAKFRLDEARLHDAGLRVTDITADTIPHDFSRTPKVHRCYLVTKA